MLGMKTIAAVATGGLILTVFLSNLGGDPGSDAAPAKAGVESLPAAKVSLPRQRPRPKPPAPRGNSGVNEERNASPGQLAGQVSSAFSTHPEAAARAAELLLRHDPGNYGAAKAKLTGLMAHALRLPQGTDRARALDEARSALFEAEKMSTSTDPELLDAKILLAAQAGRVDEVEALARDELPLAQADGRADYHLAWVAYQRGDRAAALRHLEQAQRAAPSNRLYGATAMRLSHLPERVWNTEGQKPPVFEVILGYRLRAERDQ